MLWTMLTPLRTLAQFMGGPTKAQLRARAHRQQAMRLKARYDAAQTTAENAEHWSQADDLSAQAANTLAIRRTLRRRSRYECANNCYAAGILLTIANDLVGSGPRLQMQFANPADNATVEKEFTAWAREVGLAAKLRTAVITKKRDGEVFVKFVTNPNHLSPVWFDIELLEGDQVTTPTLVPDELHIDGITFDTWQQAETYDVLPMHPGDNVAFRSYVPNKIPARLMCHWFRTDRPGQRRGIPEITPGLPLLAQLRRFTLSVLTASETASDHAAVLESTAAPDPDSVDGDLGSLSPFDDVQYSRGLLTAVPFGWKLSQLRAEQPTTTYGMFKQEILNEFARCIHVPYNVAAGNSAGYNYSSGRLDHKGYYGAIQIEQSDCELVILDRVFRAWYAEARLIRRPDSSRLVPDVDLSYYRPWAWAWDPPADIDPMKTSGANANDLAFGMTSFQDIFAAKGQDWVLAQTQQAQSLGISLDDYRGLLRQKLFGAAASTGDPSTMQARRRKRKPRWMTGAKT